MINVCLCCSGDKWIFLLPLPLTYIDTGLSQQAADKQLPGTAPYVTVLQAAFRWGVQEKVSLEEMSEMEKQKGTSQEWKTKREREKILEGKNKMEGEVNKKMSS